MTLKDALTTLLRMATNVPIYWDLTAPDFLPKEPFIILQQVGGKGRQWYLDGAETPTNDHSRIQVTCYARSRIDADALALNVENTIRTSGLVAENYGAAIGGAEEAIAMFTCHQDFGFNYPVTL